MAQMRGGHLVIGVGLVVIGFLLTIIEFFRWTDRATATGPVPACAPVETVARTTAAPAPEASEPGVSPRESGSAIPATGPSAAPAAATSAEAPSDADSRLFKFSAGGAVMSHDEVMKMLTLGKALARHPTAKVSIEGFGDLPGNDPLMVGIGRHRAKVGATLLAKSGVTEDRVTLAFSDMGSDGRLARTIRVTTMPPISEVEKP
jgi:outer membrane protein OmpA-like peptidoglycan-associated protein